MNTRRFPTLAAMFLILTTTTAIAGNRAGCDDATLHATADDIGTPPDFTGFGSSVAISGDTAVVGLPDRTVEGEVGPRSRVALYTCDRRTHTWLREGSLEPEDQRESESDFGSALALEGNRLVVGSRNAVRVYRKRSRSRHGDPGEWQVVLKLAANGVDRFIGPTLAYQHPYLAVTVVKVANETPVRFVDIYRVTRDNQAHRVARLAPSEDFTALALDRGVLVAGPQVYTRRKDGKWRLQQVLRATPSDDSFGTAAVAVHRRTILVGSPMEELIPSGDEGPTSGGAVYVFQFQDGTWQQTQRIRPGTGQSAFNGFGQTLALSRHYAAIGAPFAMGGFQREFGPTFLYRATHAGFVFDRELQGIATSIDLAQRQLIIGTNVNVQGTPITGASIQRLQPSGMGELGSSSNEAPGPADESELEE